MGREPEKMQKSEDLFEVSWRRSCVPGVNVSECMHADHACPIGTVYWRWMESDTIQICNTFVFDMCRRNGIRTRINNALFEWYPKLKHITTGPSTKDGVAWMKAYGYKQRKDGVWAVHRSTRKKKEK